MSEKIVSIRSGIVISAPGEVSDTTVGVIERLLTMAQSGEINGIVALVTYSDGAVGEDHNAGIPVTYKLVGRMLQITNEFASTASNAG